MRRFNISCLPRFVLTALVCLQIRVQHVIQFYQDGSVEFCNNIPSAYLLHRKMLGCYQFCFIKNDYCILVKFFEKANLWCLFETHHWRTVQLIMTAFQGNPYVSKLTLSQKQAVAIHMLLCTYEPDDVVIKQGESGDRLYVITCE